MQGANGFKLRGIEILDGSLEIRQTAPTGPLVEQKTQSELQTVAEARKTGLSGGLGAVLAPEGEGEVGKRGQQLIARPLFGVGFGALGQEVPGGPRPVSKKRLGTVVHGQKAQNAAHIECRLHPRTEGEGNEGGPVAVAGDALCGSNAGLKPARAGQVLEAGQGQKGLQAALVGGIHGPPG